jgi:hypothetical protein
MVGFNEIANPADQKDIPGRRAGMKAEYFSRLRDSEGKGVLGCIILIVLLAAAIYVGIVLAPIYYANFNFESGVKTEISRAGAHFLDDETIIKDILDLARRNEIRLTRRDISIERFAGQIHLKVQYSVPVEFLLFEHDLSFKVDLSSFVGTL